MKLNVPFLVEEGLVFLSRCSRCGPNEAGSPVIAIKDIKEWEWETELICGWEKRRAVQKWIRVETEGFCVCDCVYVFGDASVSGCFHTTLFVSRHLVHYDDIISPHSLFIMYQQYNTLSHTQKQLTPCFRLSLTWSATSDTITSAAVDKKLQS